jgi:hypothetical protein
MNLPFLKYLVASSRLLVAPIRAASFHLSALNPAQQGKP